MVGGWVIVSYLNYVIVCWVWGDKVIGGGGFFFSGLSRGGCLECLYWFFCVL